MNNQRLINAEITKFFKKKNNELKKFVKIGKENFCLEKIHDLWFTVNRYRYSDHEYYFDTEINKIIRNLNKKKFNLNHLFKKKNKFKILYVMDTFNTYGGVAFPQKLILENGCSKLNIEQHVLFVNLKDVKRSEIEKTESYKYLIKYCDVKKIDFVPDRLNLHERGKYIENWIHQNKIDFSILKAQASTLYAAVSQPSPIVATYSPDWLTFTLGPGIGDYTLCILTGQVYNYKGIDEKNLINIRMGLPNLKYIKSSKFDYRKLLNIPKSSIVSATTNIYKCIIGNDDFLFRGIKKLLLENKNYHHIFAGTKRGYDDLQSFFCKYKSISKRVHYVGEVDNIYNLLNSIDFYINSFPISGSSNVEAAICGKPSIDTIGFSRSSSGHGPEMLKTHECEVLNFDEFIYLGNKLINDHSYRRKLGKYNQEKTKYEYDKYKIMERMIDLFKIKFNQKLCKNNKEVQSNKNNEIHLYEKLISDFQKKIINKSFIVKKKHLDKMKEINPKKMFAWLKDIEINIIHRKKINFEKFYKNIPKEAKLDFRFNSMLSLYFFYNRKKISGNKFFRITKKINKNFKDLDIFKKILQKKSHKEIKFLILKSLPIYYDY